MKSKEDRTSDEISSKLYAQIGKLEMELEVLEKRAKNGVNIAA
ncbi:MAG: hypothetical protein RR202_13655 [Bacteroidales bacterium]